MPEEKKKDSFTFSDKIKNSKRPVLKSFVNRISSKIGSDGKPRQTLFERTRRDAPFFIAAIVALLLLPFLYKYSGRVSDDTSLITPDYEDVFNPDRSGFDYTGNPDDQISQLSGRDALDLIVGLGNEKEEEAEDDTIYRSGLDSASSYKRTEADEEINNTNIYKYRKQAPAQTRAAFRRASTKIGNLRGAGLTNRGGGRLNIGMWGGGLKNAAQRVRGERPTTSPKPVSLQPVHVTGKPSRSAFGQGAAAEARRSKNAMSKGNAMQALMEAQMKPVEPGRIGGITGGDLGGPGGGNGRMERNFAYNMKEPWWWDLMKTRSQAKWQAHFDARVKIMNKLLDGLLGLGSCLLFGSDDFSVDHFFGSASSGAECCGIDQEGWLANPKLAKLPFTELACKHNRDDVLKAVGKAKWDDCGAHAWKEPTEGGGFVGTRFNCAGGSWSGLMAGLRRGNGKYTVTNCELFAKEGSYFSNFSSGKPNQWREWTYVVGVNAKTLEEYYKAPTSDQLAMQEILYITYGPILKLSEVNTAFQEGKAKGIPLFVESVAVRTKKQHKEDWILGRKLTVDEIDRIMRGMQGKPYAELAEFVSYGGPVRLVSSDGDSSTEMYVDKRKKFRKEGKGWAMSDRCQYPLAQIKCEYGAVYDGTGLAHTINGKTVPYAHLEFPGMLGKATTYQDIRGRFMVSYNVHGEDPTITDGSKREMSSATNQWFQVPLYNNIPVSYTWKGPETGKSAYFGKDYFGYGGDMSPFLLPEKKEGKFQVLARHDLAALTGEVGADKTKSTGEIKPNKRVWITWEIRQCPKNYVDLVDSKNINLGKCNEGLLSGGKGQAKPGEIVSTATCVYYDGGDADGNIGFTGVPSNQEVVRTETNNTPVEKISGGTQNGLQTVAPSQRDVPVPTDQGPAEEEEQPQQTAKPREVTTLNLADKLEKISVEWPKRAEIVVPHDGGSHLNNANGNGSTDEGTPGVHESEALKAISDAEAKAAEKENRDPKSLEELLEVPANQKLVKEARAQDAAAGGGAGGNWPSDEELAALRQQATAQAPYHKFLKNNGNENCTLDGIQNKKVFDNSTVKDYVDNIVRQANERAKTVRLNTVTTVSVANLVDAMEIAQSIGVTDVPINVVCALGKTIGLESRDPYVTKRPNQFGAFAAYIGEDSSYFPAANLPEKDAKGKLLPDDRFLGCSGSRESGVGNAYHYGHYNWNELKDGDLDRPNTKVDGTGPVGYDGRRPFVQTLQGNGNASYDTGKKWTNAKNEYPLAAIGKTIGFDRKTSFASQKELKEAIKAVGGTVVAPNKKDTIDNYNRRVYAEAYRHLFNKTESCGLSGTMKVADALEYVHMVCTNGTRAKPSNGNVIKCGKHYIVSDVAGQEGAEENTEEVPQ